MVCRWCGRWNADDNAFCAYCGQRLDTPSPGVSPEGRGRLGRPQNPARNALEADKASRRSRRRKAHKMQGRMVMGLHFAVTVVLLALCFIYMWRRLAAERVIADWLDPNRPFETFALEKTPDSFGPALEEIRDSAFAATPGLVKWTGPLRLRWEGDAGPDDLATLARIVADFNSIPGFPGIEIVEEGENLLVAFAGDEAAYWAYYEALGGETDGMTSFCRRLVRDGVYERVDILITPKDSSQNQRNSVILHEMTHMTGFLGHLADEDSILHENALQPSMSDTDLLALEMLYDPALPLGASYDEVAAYFEAAYLADYLGPWGGLVPPGPPVALAAVAPGRG